MSTLLEPPSPLFHLTPRRLSAMTTLAIDSAVPAKPLLPTVLCLRDAYARARALRGAE